MGIYHGIGPAPPCRTGTSLWRIWTNNIVNQYVSADDDVILSGRIFPDAEFTVPRVVYVHLLTVGKDLFCLLLRNTRNRIHIIDVDESLGVCPNQSLTLWRVEIVDLRHAVSVIYEHIFIIKTPVP